MNASPNNPSGRQPRRASTPGGQTNWQQAMHEAGPYLGLGMQLALAMLFFTGGGYLLDRAFGLTPWLTVAGAALGMVAFFAQLFRISNDLARQSKARRKTASGGAASRAPGATGRPGDSE